MPSPELEASARTWLLTLEAAKNIHLTSTPLNQTSVSFLVVHWHQVPLFKDGLRIKRSSQRMGSSCSIKYIHLVIIKVETPCPNASH